MEKNTSSEFLCSLLPAELRRRKKTVLANLKDKLIEKKELINGYSYCFPGSDEMLDELIDFIKTERKCCGFLNFKLVVASDQNNVRIELTGDPGVKDFINAELGL
jgi:hypothetical protein